MNKLILLVCTALMVGCTANVKENLTESGLKRSNFQTEVNGEKTDLISVDVSCRSWCLIKTAL